MQAATPHQVHELWTRAFVANDLPALLALYEADAVLAPSPDERYAGLEQIRVALEKFLALRPQFQMHTRQVVQADDVAVLFSEWRLVGTGPDGGEIHMGGLTADVVRRQGDGTWLMAIDNPFGGGYSNR